jgi:drug/metabolite transporter (DMT)-like permease
MSPLASASSNPLRGILCSLAGIFLLTTSDAGVKWLTDTLPFGEVLFIRTLFAMFAIALIVWHRGGIASLHIVSPRNLAVRALFGTGSTFIIVASLSLLPIGEVLTMVFVTPLLVAALATPLLGERVGWHRWLAILAGFAGVVIMLRPGAETFTLAALLPLLAALVASLRDIVTRRISATESSLAILAFSILGLLAASLATLPFGWRPPGAIDIAIAGASGLLFGAAHYLMIEGYRHAEASLVAPFRYTNLIWAPLWGFVLWHEVPGIGLLTGAPLIAAGGLYVLYRERADRKALPVAPVQYPESEFRDP